MKRIFKEIKNSLSYNEEYNQNWSTEQCQIFVWHTMLLQKTLPSFTGLCTSFQMIISYHMSLLVAWFILNSIQSFCLFQNHTQKKREMKNFGRDKHLFWFHFYPRFLWTASKFFFLVNRLKNLTLIPSCDEKHHQISIDAQIFEWKTEWVFQFLFFIF